jgi:hypothetical protein
MLKNFPTTTSNLRQWKTLLREEMKSFLVWRQKCKSFASSPPSQFRETWARTWVGREKELQNSFSKIFTFDDFGKVFLPPRACVAGAGVPVILFRDQSG